MQKTSQMFISMFPFEPAHDRPTRPLDAGPPLLLVSVRCEHEFADALSAEVDVLDLKEPRQGPLAPASQHLLQTVARRWEAFDRARPALSAALGESDQASQVAAELPRSFAFAKAGPSGCDTPASIKRLWKTVNEQLGDATSLVAVAYADHEAANCRPASEIFRLAGEWGIRWCLLDTFRKDGRSSLDQLGFEAIRTLRQITAESNQFFALAGSLKADDVLQLHAEGISPNCFGVRGDVCDGNRTGRLSTRRIADWQAALATTRPTPSRSS